MKQILIVSKKYGLKKSRIIINNIIIDYLDHLACVDKHNILVKICEKAQSFIIYQLFNTRIVHYKC